MNSTQTCIRLYCSRKRAPRRLVCHRCKHQRHKEINLLSYTFSNLKQNARRRGKDFNLTIEQFRQFVLETGYLEKKGRGANNLTIDRIENDKGYEPGNLQVLTLSQNVRKKYVDYFQQQPPPL